MKRARALLLALAAAAAGCSIPLFEAEPTPVNECSTSDDCAAGGVCATVGAGNACVATRADLPGLLLEIRPAATSGKGGGVTSFVDLAEQELILQDVIPAGQVRRFDPQLPIPARIDGTLRLPAGAPRCGLAAPDDASYPARVIFRRVARLPGLPPEEYTATSQSEAGDDGQLRHSFHADLPVGTYDIHIAPELPPDCTDGPLPMFLPAQRIEGSGRLNIEPGAPQRLWGYILVPASMRVDGWSLEIVDPEHGDLISESALLVQNEGDQSVEFDLDYDWTSTGFTRLIRLRPPAGEALPTIHWDLAAAAINVNPATGVELTLADLDAVPRHVEGQVADENGAPVVATVQIQSAEISGDTTATAKYRLEVETDESGVFAADLPPGRYRIVARPVDLTHAAAVKEIEFDAGDDCFCGQSIEVPDMTLLVGSAAGPAGEAMGTASVVASPSALASPRYFDQVLALSPQKPRESSTQLYAGAFALEVDPGYFDFTIRPADGSGYPWLARPRLSVAGADIAAEVDLGALTVPYPAVLHGVIRDTTGAPLPGAVVRAWLPVGDPTDKDAPVGVIQIGATLAQSDGSYILPLPPSLSE